MHPPDPPRDDPCSRAAPRVERALRDRGWQEIRLACRDGRLRVEARCPGEPAETPPGHCELGPAAVAPLRGRRCPTWPETIPPSLPRRGATGGVPPPALSSPTEAPV